jgi:hypothetical protein
MPGDRQCEAQTQAGTRCRGQALTGSAYCFAHDTAQAEARAEARRRGGRAAIRGATVLPEDTPDLPLASVADVTALLGQSINEVRKGKIDPRVANAVGYLGNILLRALEGGELARQLEELRREVEELKNEHGHDAPDGGDAAAGAGPGGGA